MNPRILFVTFAAILVFIICFFTARVYIYGLNLNSHPAKGILVTALIIPVLYISSFFGTNHANRLGKTYYTAVNIIAGIFFYLFLGAVALGVTGIVFLIIGTNIPLAIVWGILIVSVIAAVFSFIQAKRIVVTRYDVVLPHAPASWHGKTAAMISDTHFGLINYTKFSDRIVNKLLALKPDFVLHAGDFYDGPIVDTTPITASWKKLTAQIPLFYTPGNHEAYGDYKLFVESVRAAGATVLDDKMVEYDGVQIAGTLYRAGKESSELAQVLKGLSLDKNKPTILINHPPTSFVAPHEHGVKLIVSGHTHQGQTWPLRYITHKVYGKYDYGMHPYKDLTSITSDGIGTYGPPIRLFNSPEIVMITFK